MWNTDYQASLTRLGAPCFHFKLAFWLAKYGSLPTDPSLTPSWDQGSSLPRGKGGVGGIIANTLQVADGCNAYKCQMGDL